MDKPGILEIVDKYVDLRSVGREHRGLCPFHADKTPSFYVNEKKQVFLCRACGVGGDVIDFVMKLDGLTFLDACAVLGIENGRRPVAPILTAARRHAAKRAAAWVNDQRAKFNVMLADALESRDRADEIGGFELAEIIDRELICLTAFYDALEHPRGAAEMLALRESIEQITDGARMDL